MLVIPFEVTPGKYSVAIILGDDHIARIRGYDPATVALADLPADWHDKELQDLVVAYATDAEQRTAVELCRQGKSADAIRLVTRGFRFRPDVGDGEDPELLAARRQGIAITVPGRGSNI